MRHLWAMKAGLNCWMPASINAWEWAASKIGVVPVEGKPGRPGAGSTDRIVLCDFFVDIPAKELLFAEIFKRRRFKRRRSQVKCIRLFQKRSLLRASPR